MSDSDGKPFVIPKQRVWEAYRRVAANKGAAGVDGQSIEDFEKNLRNNLYRIWNRMSSGTYFPPPVLRVDIPKADGGTRTLGLPTVADRVAQTVVALTLEPRTESIFVDDSYGYRPRKSALDAVAACRQRCWKKGWAIDLDLQKFFDSVPWELMIKAVRANITQEQRWVLLYVRRWLAAPMQTRDGVVIERDRGTPQGSAVSPVLANLFMHYAFDTWLAREFPTVEFERYADDAIVHCVTKRQAETVLAALKERMEQVGVRLHPDKTKVVYCKSESRRGDHAHTSFVFLGYEFRARSVKGKDGRMHVSFTPAVSPKALKAMGQVVRSWRLHRHTGTDLNDLAKQLNPIVAGWMNYYGRYNRSELYPLLRRINTYLMRWARRKYKRLHAWKRLWRWWTGLLDRDPGLFAQWAWECMSFGYR